jgi:hypothetical protein
MQRFGMKIVSFKKIFLYNTCRTFSTTGIPFFYFLSAGSSFYMPGHQKMFPIPVIMIAVALKASDIHGIFICS